MHRLHGLRKEDSARLSAACAWQVAINKNRTRPTLSTGAASVRLNVGGHSGQPAPPTGNIRTRTNVLHTIVPSARCVWQFYVCYSAMILKWACTLSRDMGA